MVLVSSADETAFEVRSQLVARGLAAELPVGDAGDRPSDGALGDAALLPADHAEGPAGPPGRGRHRHRWLSSGDVHVFRELGRRLLGPELDHAEAVSWA